VDCPRTSLSRGSDSSLPCIECCEGLKDAHRGIPYDTGMTRLQMTLYACLLTAAIEVICVVLRYGFGLESTKDTASTIGRLTFGIRIHHGYIGLLMLAIVLCCPRWEGPLRDWVLIVGIALFVSDIIHHFLVLWPIEGSPHFDLVYPRE